MSGRRSEPYIDVVLGYSTPLTCRQNGAQLLRPGMQTSLPSFTHAQAQPQACIQQSLCIHIEKAPLVTTLCGTMSLQDWCR